MTFPTTVWVMLVSAAAGIGIGVGLHTALRSSAAPKPALPELHGQAVWSAGSRHAPGFTLLDQTSRLVSLAGQRGRPVVLAFMDPLCKKECPIEARGISLAVSKLAPAQRPVILIVSVNPLARPSDTVAAARKWGITGDWHWLLGDPTELAPVWKKYDITVIGPTGGIHSTAVYLIDRSGYERAGFIAPFLPQFMADDLRVLATS